MAEELLVKDAPALSWPDVADREAMLVHRCAAGEETACSELVTDNQRMVFQLAFHLLGDYEEARDLSQDVFLQVFRTIDRFRGQSALRTWIYRIAINLARNRQRWWRRRCKSDQVSLDAHLEQHGEDVLLDRFAWCPARSLDGDALNRGAAPLLGPHDFTAFEAAGSSPANPECLVAFARWTPWEGGWRFDVQADHFLYHMVREDGAHETDESEPGWHALVRLAERLGDQGGQRRQRDDQDRDDGNQVRHGLDKVESSRASGA